MFQLLGFEGSIRVGVTGDSLPVIQVGRPSGSPAEMVLGTPSWFSLAYNCQPNINCLFWFKHWIPWALCLAFARAGKSIAAKMAMMAMTTNNSIKVKPGGRGVEPDCCRNKFF